MLCLSFLLGTVKQMSRRPSDHVVSLCLLMLWGAGARKGPFMTSGKLTAFLRPRGDGAGLTRRSPPEDICKYHRGPPPPRMALWWLLLLRPRTASGLQLSIVL